jgi:hypothetical protein
MPTWRSATSPLWKPTCRRTARWRRTTIGCTSTLGPLVRMDRCRRICRPSIHCPGGLEWEAQNESKVLIRLLHGFWTSHFIAGVRTCFLRPWLVFTRARLWPVIQGDFERTKHLVCYTERGRRNKFLYYTPRLPGCRHEVSQRLRSQLHHHRLECYRGLVFGCSCVCVYEVWNFSPRVALS